MSPKLESLKKKMKEKLMEKDKAMKADKAMKEEKAMNVLVQQNWP